MIFDATIMLLRTAAYFIVLDEPLGSPTRCPTRPPRNPMAMPACLTIVATHRHKLKAFPANAVLQTQLLRQSHCSVSATFMFGSSVDVEQQHIADATESAQLANESPMLTVFAHGSVDQDILHIAPDDITDIVAITPSVQLKDCAAVAFGRLKKQVLAICTHAGRLHPEEICFAKGGYFAQS